MIVDCHSHIWTAKSRLGEAQNFLCLGGPEVNDASAESHYASASPADFTFVLGFISNLLNAEIANDEIKSYVASHPDRLIGFAGIDPTDQNCLENLRRFHEDPAFAGLTLSPAGQGFHPCDSRAMRLYELAEKLDMPIYFLQGDILPPKASLKFSQPADLDEVAQNFPALPIVVSHLGFPWTEQMICLLAKHPNVFSDIAGLAQRPWQAYRTLTLAYEFGVIEKLLLASDFPANTITSAIEAIYNLNKLTRESVLPAIPREQLRGIVERDTLSLLGLKIPRASSTVSG